MSIATIAPPPVVLDAAKRQRLRMLFAAIAAVSGSDAAFSFTAPPPIPGGEAAVAAMTALCDALGFAHRPITVIARPLERLANLLDGRGAADPQWMALAEPPQAYLPRIAATRSTRHGCESRFNPTVINQDGTVALCRGVVDTPNRLGLRFIVTPHAELEAARYRHPLCTTCMRHGMSCSVPDASKIG